MQCKSLNENLNGSVFNIQRFSIHDGPGIRTLVFLKGCPLRCLWCSNPESQNIWAEPFLTRTKCIGCGLCKEACPTGAIDLLHAPSEDSSFQDICIHCNKCSNVCPSRAIVQKGGLMSVSEVMKTIRKDISYYKNSSGGVTIGGGEPCFQPDFAAEILRQCKSEEIDTTVETCGFASWENLKKLADYTDHFLFDIKHMDSEMHKKLTGQSNDIILENAKRISEAGIDILIRVPVIWGCNDSEENIQKTAAFAKDLSNGGAMVELLPYHRAGESKYTALGRNYSLAGLEPDETGRIDLLRNLSDNIK